MNPETQDELPRSTAQFGLGDVMPEIDPAKELGIQAPRRMMNESYSALEHDKSHTQDLLSDVTEDYDDTSLNQSGIKMMMNNPLGLNQSYLDNKSGLDISRSKLNYSGISQKPELGLDRSRLQGVQFNIDPNREFGQEEIDLRVAQFDEHMLSQMTDDTVDLSHMSMPRFKNQFYQKDNSFYLNMTGLDVSNISAMKDKSRSFIQNKTQEVENKSMNKSKFKENAADTSANILGDLYVSQHDISQTKEERKSLNKSSLKENLPTAEGFEPRETANFADAPEQNIVINDQPRPTGQFGAAPQLDKSHHIAHEKSQNISQVKESQQQSITPLQDVSVTMNEKGEQSFGKEDVAQDKSNNEVKPRFSAGEENREHQGDTSQIMAHHGVGLSKLDISNISMFQPNRGDEDEFIGNVTAHNVHGFLSTSYMRGSVESDKKEDGTDAVLEFNNQDITPEKKSHAAELDQPKIQEVSLAKEETQVIEESKDLTTPSKEHTPQQTSFAAETALPERKQREVTSKSFMETKDTAQENPAALNRSYGHNVQAAYDKYSNPFSAPQDILENRLTLGQPSIGVTVTEQPEEIAKRAVVKGMNKSYEYAKAENEVKSLNKSYHNPFDTQGQNIEVKFSKNEPKDISQESFATAKGEPTPQDPNLLPTSQYISEVSRFTFQRPGVDPAKLERSFEISKKITPLLETTDKLSQSFDFMAKAGAQYVPPQHQAKDNSYIFNESRSVSDLNISQGPVANPHQFANPLFNITQENPLNTSQINAADEQKVPLSNSATSVIDRIFQGFTLGPKKAISTNQSFEAKDDPLHKSFDNAYSRGTLKQRPDINIDHETLVEKLQSEQQNQSSLAPAANDKSLSRIGLAYLQDEQQTSQILNPNEVNKSVSRIGLGYMQEDEEKSVAHHETSQTNEFLNKSALSAAGAGLKEESPSKEILQQPLEDIVQKEEIKEPERPMEIKIPLKLKTKERVRPQILTPKGTVKLPEDTPFLIDMVLVENKGKSKKPSFDNLIKQYPGSEKNTRKKFFGFKLKKEKFVRAVNERTVSSDDLQISTESNPNLLIEEEDLHIHESLDKINLKLQDIRKKLDDSPQDLSKIKLNLDKIIVEDQNTSLIGQAIVEIEEALEEDSTTLSVLLLKRSLILSKQKYSKIDLATLDNRSLAAAISQAQFEPPPFDTQINKVRFLGEDNHHARYIKHQYKVELEVLAEIRSDVDISDEDDGSYQGSSVSNTKPLRFDRSSGYKAKSEAGKTHNQKMKFYSEAVNIRLDLPPGHPGRELDIGQIYNECLEKGVAETEWKNFLNSKFQI